LRERRRHARRKFVCEARLPVGVSMPDEEIDPEAESYPEPILGHTLDLSESGLSLALPAVSLGGTDVTRPGARLRLVLSLPTGLIVVQAETVRAAPLQAGPGDPARHVVGARITKLFETDRRNYRDFLRRFATGRTG
jgi:hypothetical protein